MVILSLPASRGTLGKEHLSLGGKLVGTWTWFPLVALDLTVYVVFILPFIDVNFRFYHLGVFERFNWLVRCGREACLLNWLFWYRLPNDWRAQSWLHQIVILIQVRSLFFPDYSCLFEISVSVTLETKASESSVLNELHLRFVCCWLRGLFLFLHLFNFASDG